ncbi:alpha/beta hydrolase fold domain-containing protein [Arthrobacter sp. zg-Y179]|uniref:alpha/beta hydrolase fold domain-containing protein n=1 Tax=Arthrobacter sp. zg-Y179 TaxID=2894188 RepID=UPI001E438FBD|nr:alpha/beta hydrolase fold domain-containing protein [Arthrobacter sp. zg-Y179]MCC9174979.1 alpha/beta hydrolase [Arthrobacter sp. zg-Y179]
MESIADPALAAWLDGIRTGESVEPSLETIRLLRKDRARPPGPELASVTDVTIPGRPALRARLYRSGAAAQPLTVFVHGGGFVFGGLESHDRLCRRLALLANTAVLAVDYRLAPEHPAPAAVDDIVCALAWAAGGRAGRVPEELGPVLPGVGLAGDSAGGLIAFLAARRLAGTPAGPAVLFLAYPNADLTLSAPSIRGKGEGWGLPVRDLAFYISQWVPNASPGTLAEFSPVHGFPLPGPGMRVRTILATAEHDPLRDEGELLAGRLTAEGIEVEHVPHAGLVHGFLTLDTVSPAARLAGDELLGHYGRVLTAAGNCPPDARC